MKDKSLKQGWHKLAAKIDALSLRERVLAFGACAALLIFLLFSLLLNPLFAKQKMLNESIAQQQQMMSSIDAEILLRIRGGSVDPDAQDRQALDRLRQEMTGLSGSLRTAQSGLVPPERMVFLLERLLRQHARLRLESLKTLPSAPVGAAAPAPVLTVVPPAPVVAAAAPPAPAIKRSPLLYRHGVEVVLRGGYIDMVNYMEALEAMPTRVFWGDARLEVEQYPHASLHLTLYTLSLDDKWISL